jgi:hypothetical protein
MAWIADVHPTADKKEELAQLQKDTGARTISRESAEDALFGEGKSDELLVELSKDYDDIKTSVDDASDAVDALVKAMDDLGDATGINIDGVASTAWSALLLHIRTVAAEIKLVAQVIEWVAEKATKLTRLPGLVKDLVGGGGPLATLAGAAGVAPTVGGLGGAAGGDNNSTNTTALTAHVTVNGATNPEATGRTVGDAVADTLLDLRGQFAGAWGGG